MGLKKTSGIFFKLDIDGKRKLFNGNGKLIIDGFNGDVEDFGNLPVLKFVFFSQEKYQPAFWW